MTTNAKTYANENEIHAHTLLLMVLRCKNAMDRISVAFTMKRPDSVALLVACDWLLEQGFVTYGTTNASAKVWSRRVTIHNGQRMSVCDSDALLYLTKAGKAWLREWPGHDFGSGANATARRALLWAQVDRRNAELKAVAS